MHQEHLSRGETVNFGAYYTAPKHVKMIWKMMANRLPPDAVVLDNACGYGGFLQGHRQEIGCDIDKEAVIRARASTPAAKILHANAMENVSRQKFGIAPDAFLAMIGNPPFNDRTSQIRRGIKNMKIPIDADLRTRDMGISFLRSFDKLQANLVCVLHPLSYLIKPANFALLRNFASNYVLLKAKIISSACFPANSRVTSFPIAAALYERRQGGMDYEHIRRFRFATGRAGFAVSDFQYVSDFIRKYPQSRRSSRDIRGIAFYPMRDINALRRNRTFVFPDAPGRIYIDRDQLPYYAYADVFKRFSHHVPYYFGNSDVMIDNAAFLRNRRHFLFDTLLHHPQLRKHVAKDDIKDGNAQTAEKAINAYFKNLLGNHYEN